MCVYRQVYNTDNLDWQIGSGTTETDSTGPTSAYSGTKYIFLESSSPARRNDKAELISPTIQPNGKSHDQCRLIDI